MKRSEKVVLGLALVGVAAGAFYVAARTVTSRRRDAAMARLLSTPQGLRPAAPAPEPSVPAPDVAPEVAPAVPATPTPPADALSTLYLLEEAKVLNGDWPWYDFVKEWHNSEPISEEKLLEGEQLASAHAELIAHATAIASTAEMKLPKTYDSRTAEALADLLLFHAELAFHHDDTDRGVQCLATALELGSACTVNHFSGNSPWQIIYSYAYDTIYWALPDPLPPQHLQELTPHLNNTHHRATLALDLTESAMTTAEQWPVRLEQIRNRRVSPNSAWYEQALDRVEGQLDDLLQQPPHETLYKSAAGRSLVDRDIAAYLDLVARTRDVLLMPYGNALPLAQNIDGDAERLQGPYFLVQMYFRPAVSEIDVLARLETLMGLANTGMHIERYRADFNRCPESLDAIGVDLPRDPYSGRDFMYATDDPAFVLYSVGENQRDDKASDDDIIWRRGYADSRRP